LLDSNLLGRKLDRVLLAPSLPQPYAADRAEEHWFGDDPAEATLTPGKGDLRRDHHRAEESEGGQKMTGLSLLPVVILQGHSTRSSPLNPLYLGDHTKILRYDLNSSIHPERNDLHHNWGAIKKAEQR
jgi:hypothetical protein